MKPHQILLVEDNEGDVFLVRRALEKLGLPHELHLARDGEEALAVLNHSPHAKYPELILLDLNLPRIDGFEILSHIRSAPGLQRTPVIIMTSSDSPGDRETSLRRGADVYFRKPTELSAFMELGLVVARLLAAPQFAPDMRS